MPAEAHFTALPDEEFAAIGKHQMVRVKAVPRLNALVEPFGAVTPLIRDHPAFAGAGRRAGHRCPARERRLCLIAQGAKAHAGDVNRDVELKRPFCTWPNDRFGLAFLAIALDHEAGQSARQKRQIIPVRNLLEKREAPHPVAAEFGLDMDVVHDPWREDEAVTDPIDIAVQLFLGGWCTVRHSLFLSKGCRASLVTRAVP